MNKFKRQKIFFAIFPFILLASFIFSIYFGYTSISFSDIFTTIFKPYSANASLILREIRLPRVVLAALCGMGLALSGCTLQAVTENPLADPAILGINSGSGFMVMLFLSLFPKLHINAMIYQPLFAMFGGLLVIVVLYKFAKRQDKINPKYLLLGGIGIGAGFQAIMIIMGSDLDNSIYPIVSRWLAGNIWGTSWYQVKTLIPYLIVLIPWLFTKINILDMFLLGEDGATSLGVNVQRERKVLLVISIAIASSCIAVCGGINFVGLVSPHIAKKLVGVRHRVLLPASMLIGSFFMMMSDTVGRAIFESIEIPVGIVVSILASPYFIYLLYKKS